MIGPHTYNRYSIPTDRWSELRHFAARRHLQVLEHPSDLRPPFAHFTASFLQAEPIEKLAVKLWITIIWCFSWQPDLLATELLIPIVFVKQGLHGSKLLTFLFSFVNFCGWSIISSFYLKVIKERKMFIKHINSISKMLLM